MGGAFSVDEKKLSCEICLLAETAPPPTIFSFISGSAQFRQIARATIFQTTKKKKKKTADSDSQVPYVFLLSLD
jgi:hypothetical protein